MSENDKQFIDEEEHDTDEDLKSLWLSSEDLERWFDDNNI